MDGESNVFDRRSDGAPLADRLTFDGLDAPGEEQEWLPITQRRRFLRRPGLMASGR